MMGIDTRIEGTPAAGARSIADDLMRLLGIGSDLASELGAEAFQARSDDYMSAAYVIAERNVARRSGNPAIRSGSQPPDPAKVHTEMKSGRAGQAARASGTASTASTWTGRAGTAISIGFTANELASGGSPTSIAAGISGSTLAGFAFSAGVGFVVAGSAVAAAPVVLGVGVTIAAGLAAVWAYESLVPQETREKWDEGVRDMAKGVTDFLWNATHA
ncbi:MAG: hypothetical protein ACK5Q5_24990 [Planctomycetaceae bacterium]